MTIPNLPSTSGVERSLLERRRRGVFRTVVRNPAGVISLTVLIGIVALGLLSPWITGSPYHSDLNLVNAPVGSPGYLLGGDSSGRDIFARLLASINIAMICAAVGTGIAVLVGTVGGLISGYVGGRLDDVMSWVFNLLMTFPGIILLIVLFPVTGGSYPITMAIFGFLLSPGVFRLVQNLVVGVRSELYVDAARVSGLSDWRILGRHILYVVRGPLIVQAAFLAGACIGMQTGLAFLGLGSSEVPSWGEMISSGFRNFYSAQFQFVWPSLALGITTTAFVLLGNACRDALESRATPTRADRKRIEGERARFRPVQRVVGEARVDHVLEVRNLTISYPGIDGTLRPVVQDVNLTVRRGEVLGLVGESGSGKTQTAFAALGLLPKEAFMSGSIVVDGADLSTLTAKQLLRFRGSRIAYIPQEPMSNLDPTFTVGHQLVFGIRASRSVSLRAAEAEALELLERVGIRDPKRVFLAYPHEISGGMAQRVLIAGAVASRPALLVADEPTTALDVTVQADILDLLRELQREMGMSILLVTHNFGVVADICDRVVVMCNGTMIEANSTAALLEAPQEPYTKMLLDSILDESDIRSPLSPEREPDVPLLTLQNVRVAFRGHGIFAKSTEVLHGVSVVLAAGETLGLVGESGSGKTTLGRAVLGLIKPSHGEVLLDGQPRDQSDRRKLAQDIQVVFQDPYTSLNPALTIGDTLSEPLIAQGVKRAEAREQVAHLLELVNLPSDALHRMPREFSGGQRQRVAIARALALSPRLIVCDEPVSALDLSNQMRVLDLLIELQERTGVAYLFISHDLTVIRRISHRVAVMYRGEIVETGPVEEVTTNPSHAYTKRLLLSSPVVDPTQQKLRREERSRIDFEIADTASREVAELR